MGCIEGVIRLYYNWISLLWRRLFYAVDIPQAEEAMIKQVTCNKDYRGWFFDLPNWEGDTGALKALDGMDVLLDLVSRGNTQVALKFGDKQASSTAKFTLLDSWGDAATYLMPFYRQSDYNLHVELHICMLSLFEEWPDVIYLHS